MIALDDARRAACPSAPAAAARPGRAVAALGSGILLTVALVFSLTLGELGLRLVAPAQLYRFPIGLFESDEAAGYRLTPGFEGVMTAQEYTTPLHINRQGLREERDVGAKDPARRRILALGDSFTMAYAVPTEHGYVKRLERRLNAGGERFEVLNGGVAGYSTAQELAWLRRTGRALAPDVLLLGFYLGNDVEDALRKPDAIRVRDGYLTDVTVSGGFLPQSLRLFLARHSQLYHRLWPMQRMLRGDTSGSPGAHLALYAPETGRLAPAWNATRAGIDGIAAEARALGIPLIVLLFPERLQTAPEEWGTLVARYGEAGVEYHIDRPNQVLAALLAERGIPAIDVLPALTARAAETPLYHRLDGHWTPIGNDVAAEAILQALAAQGTLS
jgi:lysophospholipase L1-like esterase